MKLIRKTSEQRAKSEPMGNMIFKLLPYWPLFLGLFIVSIIGAWIYLQFTAPLYEANARILINEKKGGDEMRSSEPMETFNPKKTVDNEREVIISAPVLQKVVYDLALYAPVLTHKQLTTKSLYKNSPVRIIVKNPLEIVEKERIDFFYTPSGITIADKKYPLNKWVKTDYGTLMFKKNNVLLNVPDGDFSFSLISPKKAATAIAEKLKVTEANKLSTILNVSFLDEEPKRAEDVLNDILKVYGSFEIDEQNRLAANTQEFIGQRLASVENELIAIESKLQNYRSTRGAVDVGAQGKLYLENVSTNDQKVGEINMQLSVLNQIEKYVGSKDLTGGIVPSTVGISDPGLTQMVKDIYELQLNTESLRKTTGENNPMVVSYKDQIAKIKPQIMQNLQNQRQSLTASRNNLSATTNNYSSALQAMPETERNLVDINRQQQIKSGIYTFLLQKKEETALSYITTGSGSKVVNPAESSEFPVSPKRKMIYLAALFGAGIAGIGFVSLKEGMRRNIMFQRDIEELTLLPVIGEITANASNKYLVMGSKQRTLIAEQFRSLRTTLHYLGVNAIRKKIMVTSAISGEGKSFIASNLAITLAMTGKRVALLDFDLNNPSIHRKFNIKQTAGISDYLQGKADTQDIINASAEHANLSILLTGALPEDPAELIMNGKAEELMTYLDAEFDYIILDVPPVGPVSDAYILAPLCDATLFVVRHSYTPKAFVERIDENIKLNNLPNPAIVFNAVAPRGFGKNNYGYGYGSGMVYGGNYDQKRLDTESKK
ncbi:polysaccharide biosynthesis tyrosine autokinase [Pedobacter heparinus]|uniref:GumC family protein n=1 Tax=Pedobacter heparinus TaxID=984 RepID=UPI00292F5EFB|nr:polysaccharide biosynthesis tyrosine autokinase [Pedobacter heparinus]